MTFPALGVNEGLPYFGQPPGTAVAALNVRTFELHEGRARGGRRRGLSRYCPTAMTGEIQDLIHVVKIRQESPEQGSLSIREVIGLVVADGVVSRFDSTDITTLTGGTALSSDVPVVFSASLFGNVYFADGVHYKWYDVEADEVKDWTATEGTLPANGLDRPRLIERWNGRIVLSGIQSDPHLWFMSKMGDPTDFDYNPTYTTNTQAVAATSSQIGGLPEAVVGLVPWTDDVLLILCEHSIWRLSGDPMMGGQLDLLTDSFGGSWGRAWCKDGHGRVYILSSLGDVRRITADGVEPVAMSREVEGGLMSPTRVITPLNPDRIDFDKNLVRMEWSQQEEGVYVWITPIDSKRGSLNMFWDAIANAWWPDRYGDGDLYPRAVHTYDGDEGDDRVILLGGRDGYIRKIDPMAVDDDGEDIESYVVMGPIPVQNPGAPYTVSSIHGVLGSGSSTVEARLLLAETEERAIANAGGGRLLGLKLKEDGNLKGLGDLRGWTTELVANRSRTRYPRRRGHQGYVQLLGTGRWAFEWLELGLEISDRDRRVAY